MGLRLLHLSDIHFGQNGPHKALDLDKNLRSEFLHDLKALVEADGPVEAILIGGDIAFSGADHEYEWAAGWIEKVCAAAGCREENVLTVPGNHDVNWGKIDEMILESQTTLRNIRPRRTLDEKLAAHWKNGKPGHLLAPLANYDTFALRYGTIPDENEIFWQKEFELDDSVIRIRGLNSAIVSNKFDDEDTGKLVLGSMQTLISREAGVIHVVMCHHPPSWLRDGEDAARQLRQTARIQLYGHKHYFEKIQIENSIQLSAGAFHPERKGDGWDPRYNLIELSTYEEDSDRKLRVEVWQRVWKESMQKFGADFSELGDIKHSFSLKLDEVESQKFPKKSAMTGSNSAGSLIERINVNTEDAVRKLRYLFFRLSYLHRSSIAHKMNLFREGDSQLSDLQKAALYFQRAKEEDRLSELWNEVAKNNAAGSISANENPFN